MTPNGQALCAVRNEDKDFREAKKFLSEWRMGVGAVLCARSQRSEEGRARHWRRALVRCYAMRSAAEYGIATCWCMSSSGFKIH